MSLKDPLSFLLVLNSPCICVIYYLRILFGNRDMNPNSGFLGPRVFLPLFYLKKSFSVYFYYSSLYLHFLCLFSPSDFFNEMSTLISLFFLKLLYILIEDSVNILQRFYYVYMHMHTETNGIFLQLIFFI